MTHWFPMELANKKGWPFIWLRRLQTANKGGGLTYSYEIIPLVREGADEEENSGYWRGSTRSIPDSTVDMSRGWWCYCLPVNSDGTIKLPDDFYTATLPGQERELP